MHSYGKTRFARWIFRKTTLTTEWIKFILWGTTVYFLPLYTYVNPNNQSLLLVTHLIYDLSVLSSLLTSSIHKILWLILLTILYLQYYLLLLLTSSNYEVTNTVKCYTIINAIQWLKNERLVLLLSLPYNFMI